MNLVYFREVVLMKIFILPVCFSAKPLFFRLYTDTILHSSDSSFLRLIEASRLWVSIYNWCQCCSETG